MRMYLLFATSCISSFLVVRSHEGDNKSATKSDVEALNSNVTALQTDVMALNLDVNSLKHDINM
jgi:outer membrane murein-binding lipoprotein Lpp